MNWLESLDLFLCPLLAALLAGAVCPLLGVLLFVRRTSFHGIALPQMAAAGMVLGFVLLPWWVEHVGLAGLDVDTALSDTHAAMNYHLAWAALATFAGLFALLVAGRRGDGGAGGAGGASEIGRVAAVFAIANAATYLLGRLSPIGREYVDVLLAGEVLTIGPHELETLALVLALVLLAIAWCGRDLVLVSFDRETARVLGKPVLRWEALLTATTGSTIAAGTMTLGPTLLFGLLVLPPLAARRFARSMQGFFALASALGAAAALIGSVLALEFDLPLGPAIVGVAALELVPGLLAGRARERA